MKNKTVYFQLTGINQKYCEAGIISETDPDYIWYYDEPCNYSLVGCELVKEYYDK